MYYLTFFLLAFFMSFLLTPWAIWLAKRLQAIRYPPSLVANKIKGEHRIIAYRRHLEKPPTPLMGGFAYILTFFILVVLGMLVSKSINFTPQNIWSYALWALGALSLFVLGILDDKYEFAGIYQFLTHAFAILLFVLSAFDIVVINIPILGNIRVDWLVWKSSVFSIVLPGDLISVVIIYMMLYALKFQAGVDGLMEGSTFIGLLFTFLSALSLAHYTSAFMAIILAGGLLGFVIYNFNPALVFSGSTGKSVIGYLVATLAIIGESKFTVILGVFALPIIDMIYVLTKRFLKYKNIKKMFIISDRTHFHYRLMKLGLTEKQICLFEYIYTALAGGLLLLSSESIKPFTFLFIWLVTFVIILYVNKKAESIS